MANLLPILLLGGAAALVMAGKKTVPKSEPEADELEPEPGVKPEGERPSGIEPPLEMHERGVLCFEETGKPGVFKSTEIENAILGKEGLWDTEIYKAFRPEAQKELTGGSWISVGQQQQLILAIAEHMKTLPIHLVPQGWGLTNDAFRENVIPVIVQALLKPCVKVTSKATENGGEPPSPESLLMNSSLKLARAAYIDSGIKTRGDHF